MIFAPSAMFRKVDDWVATPLDVVKVISDYIATTVVILDFSLARWAQVWGPLPKGVSNQIHLLSTGEVREWRQNV